LNRIRCLLVDDEPLALDVLESYVRRLESLELVARCENAIQAFDLLQSESVDLLFVDIQMPKLSGIDFLKTLPNAPKVIFTTAYRDYAPEAFDLDAVDYLLKPIPFSRFLKALGKAFSQLNGPAGLPHPFHAEDHEPMLVTDTLIVKSEKKRVKIPLKDIIFIESMRDYVTIHLPDKQIVSKQKIGNLEQKLAEKSFLRIHRSFLVPAARVNAYTPGNVEVEGFSLPIGRSYRNEVGKVLGF